MEHKKNNLMIFECKQGRKTLISWLPVLLITMGVFLGGVYPLFRDSAEDLAVMIERFPKNFMEAFGFNMDFMLGYDGFYSFSYTYFSMIMAMMAFAIAVGVFAREKKNKCMDFLLTKPRSRRSIFAEKCIASLLLFVVGYFFYVITAFVLYLVNGEKLSEIGTYLVALLGMLFHGLVFLALGTLYATVARKIRSVSSSAVTAGFAAFILAALAGMLEDEKWNYISPITYFHPSILADDPFYHLGYLLVAMLLVFGSYALAGYLFVRRDIHAV